MMNSPSATQFKIDCTYCPVRHRAICARCEGDEIERLNDIKHYRSYEPGQTIAFQGEKSEIVASVVSGVATLTTSLEDGRTQVVGLLLPSDFMGRPGRETIAHDVVAATDVTLCCFQKHPFEKLLEEIPHLNQRMLEMALDELDAAREWMLLLGRKSAREKVASFLLLIARRSGNPEAKSLGSESKIELPLSREVVANYLGLTIETVSRQLTILRKDGVIDLEGARTILIPEGAALAEAAGAID
ncbi:MAG: Crp/Fnr family transcriptional regulator [Silicimonas sp.]|nr:Crp/Fnr family transcriptional regulator [Silicimonas sp.]